jgi:hypothetical protein
MAPAPSPSLDFTFGGERVVLGLLPTLTPFFDDDHHNDACAVGRTMKSHIIRNINTNNIRGADVVAVVDVTFVAILVDRCFG